MNKLGIVFAGGGGKGGYEIGVWKQLRDIGLDKYVTVVSGTSVGALNSVLFSYGNIDLAESIWTTQIKTKILDRHSVDKYLKMLRGYPSGILPGIIIAIREIAASGLFSRDGLREIIQNNLPLSVISDIDKIIYAACCYIPKITKNTLIDLIPALNTDRTGTAEYFKLNGESSAFIETVLLASSAIPVAFKPMRINGKEYYDGGL